MDVRATSDSGPEGIKARLSWGGFVDCATAGSGASMALAASTPKARTKLRYMGRVMKNSPATDGVNPEDVPFEVGFPPPCAPLP